MKDPVLLWTIIGAVGQMLGAFATAAAVILSLWIVVWERKPKLRVSAGLRLIINGDGTPATDVIAISIANVGLQRITCTAIGWRTGYVKHGPAFLKRQYAMQNPAYTLGSPRLPIALEPGDEKTIFQDVETYSAGLEIDKRQRFFCRRSPWRNTPRPTRIDIVISLAAHNGIFKRVERNLAYFLANGTIEQGAKDFNKKAALLRA